MLVTPAYAINALEVQQLERSGCTQASEVRGRYMHQAKDPIVAD